MPGNIELIGGTAVAGEGKLKGVGEIVDDVAGEPAKSLGKAVAVRDGDDPALRVIAEIPRWKVARTERALAVARWQNKNDSLDCAVQHSAELLGNQEVKPGGTVPRRETPHKRDKVILRPRPLLLVPLRTDEP